MATTTTDLAAYRRKRAAGATPEPFAAADGGGARDARIFVVQQHRASHLHWDVRLEVAGVLRSWAVPKGPSPNPDDKRFAVQVEDHPLEYAEFEGRIPDGNYGAGHVIVWDCGHYIELEPFDEGFERGKLLFQLNGHKLRGRWTLIRLKGRNASKDGKEWLLIKERDGHESAQPPLDDSVLSGLTLDGMANPAQAGKRLAHRIERLAPCPPQGPPLSIKPMLARAGEAFDRAGWLFEVKYDGYRLLIERDGDGVTLRSRNGLDLTPNFPDLERLARRLPYPQFVMDGEAVVQDPSGRPSFALLQQRAKVHDARRLTRLARELPVTYYAFDLPQALGYDLRATPLIERKALLKEMLPSAGPLRFSDHVAEHGAQAYAGMRKLGLEGVVGKRADSPYRSGRSDDWVKVRAQRNGDFVIVGWVPVKSNDADVGALALAEFRAAGLSYCGRVGSGLGSAERREFLERLPALGKGTALAADKEIRWVAGELVCEVSFQEYSLDGMLRQPAFLRLRDDKPPAECVSAFDDLQPIEPAADAPPDVVVTNRDKTFFPEKALTKGDLVDYYERIAPWMLPYLRNRPLVLTRFPDGIHGKSFYQRDAPDFTPEWVKRASLWTDTEQRDINYFMAEGAASLKYFANLGAIPVHAWHSRIDDLAHPDWCVLDLDPKDAPFEHVLGAAKEIRDLIEELGLPGYLKTSGASGLHVLIPLARRLTHEQSRTLAELLARAVVARRPDTCTITRAVRQRGGKVYIDYLQNRHGQLIVAPFSARAEPAASVSMPLKWSELNRRLRNENFHIGNAVARLKRMGDPMRDVLTDEPDLEAAVARLAKLASG